MSFELDGVCGPEPDPNPSTDDPPVLTIDATTGSWPSDGFCAAVPNVTAPDDGLGYTASFEFNIDCCGTAHLGFAFNIQGEDQYDVVYIRYVLSSPHSSVKAT